MDQAVIDRLRTIEARLHVLETLFVLNEVSNAVGQAGENLMEFAAERHRDWIGLSDGLSDFADEYTDGQIKLTLDRLGTMLEGFSASVLQQHRELKTMARPGDVT